MIVLGQRCKPLRALEVTSRARNIRLQVLTTAFAGPRGPAPNLVRGDAAATKGNLTERQCSSFFLLSRSSMLCSALLSSDRARPVESSASAAWSILRMARSMRLGLCGGHGSKQIGSSRLSSSRRFS